MSLKDRIGEDVKAAMRAKDATRLTALRMLTAAIKQREVDTRATLEESDVVAVVERLLKQRRESIAQYEKAGREDLAARERFEAGLLEGYLPQQLGDAEIDAAIDRALAETGAATIKDMGKAMGLLKQRLAGRADMGKVSARLKSKLGS